MGPELAGQAALRAGIPALTFWEASPAADGPLEDVVLSRSPLLDGRVRGVALPERTCPAGNGAREESEQVLAAAPTGPVWSLDPETSVHRLRCALPELEPEQALRDLRDERAVALVSLIHFLRSLTGAHAFAPPPLRAAIVFDDPNLRWRTYGFIAFRHLVAHADLHSYHAAMAMIPLDGRAQHRATIELFRKHSDRLSLALHGNNHVADELMRPASPGDALALAAQALRRAARFEARYDLRMDRVMIPPHGMCSATVARALGIVGFDALCSIHPLPWTEHPPPQRTLAGWAPAEFAAGCAVIPRLPMTSPDRELALRAFLDQPLVLYGHHDDIAEGLDVLAETARRVNALGEVRWMSLGEIAATNYAGRLDGDTYRVRPYSHRIRLRMPPGAERLLVESPGGEAQRLTGWSVPGSDPVRFGASLGGCDGIVEVSLRGEPEMDATAVAAPPRRPWPLLRRVATEARDRALPLRSTIAA